MLRIRVLNSVPLVTLFTVRNLEQPHLKLLTSKKCYNTSIVSWKVTIVIPIAVSGRRISAGIRVLTQFENVVSSISLSLSNCCGHLSLSNTTFAVTLMGKLVLAAALSGCANFVQLLWPNRIELLKLGMLSLVKDQIFQP